MQMQSLIDLYRQAEDYFFKGIALKYLKLGEYGTAYLTEEAYLKIIFIRERKRWAPRGRMAILLLGASAGADLLRTRHPASAT